MRLADLPRPIVKYIIGLWRRRWFILLLAWVMSIACWVGLRMMPDAYESRAQLYFNTDTSTSGAASGLSTQPDDYDRKINTLRLQLLSAENLEKVIYDTGLNADITDNVGLEKKIASLQQGLKVLSPEQSYFNISYRDADPVVAQKVVSSLVNLFIDQDMGSSVLDYDRGLANINELIEEKKIQISRKNQEIAEFQAKNADVLANASRNDRNLELKEAELSRLELDLTTAQRRRVAILSQIDSTPRYSSGGELDKLKLELAQLRSVYNENYPDIQRLVARINELENSGSALPDNPEYARLSLALQSAQSDIATLNDRLARVRSDIATLSVAVTQIPAVQAQLADITLGSKQLEDEHQQLLERRSRLTNSARLGEMGGAVKYEVYESPKVAALPVAPPRGILTLAAVIGSLGLAAGLAFLMAQVDRTYTQGEDLEDAFGLPVLGSMSPSEGKAGRKNRFFERMGMAACLMVLFGVSGFMFLILERHSAVQDKGPVIETIQKMLLPAPKAAGSAS